MDWEEAIIRQYTKGIDVAIENECLQIAQTFGFDVNRDQLIKALTDAHRFYDDGYEAGKRDAMARLVRCRDCEYYEGGECVCPYIVMSDAAHMYPDPDDFCNHGERKDNG